MTDREMQADEGTFSDLVANETVVLYPTYGYLEPEGEAWQIYIAGTVLQPDQVKLGKRLLIRMLRRVMNVPPEALHSDIFKQRIRDFAASTERGMSSSSVS